MGHSTKQININQARAMVGMHKMERTEWTKGRDGRINWREVKSAELREDGAIYFNFASYPPDFILFEKPRPSTRQINPPAPGTIGLVFGFSQLNKEVK